MTNVVALNLTPRTPPVTAGAMFDQAWKAYPDQGRLRSSRREAQKAWAKAAREVGEEALLGAVRRYVAEDKEHKRECGPPGFHRWLNWGRYEHWLPVSGAAVETGRKRFPDEHIRRQVVFATSEAFAASYLDPCEVEGTVLVVRTGIAVDRLKEHARLFKSLGFTGMRRRKTLVDGSAQFGT